MTLTTTPAFTVAGLCRRYATDKRTILTLIKSGELQAIDISRTRGGRPRWRVTSESVERFELARSSRPAPKPVRRRRQTSAIKEYF